MNDEVLAYFGRLRNPDLASRIRKLLPEDRQARLREWQEQIAGLPDTEVRTRLREARESEWRSLWSEADRRTGGRLHRLSRRSRKWICELVQKSHGREDHQG